MTLLLIFLRKSANEQSAKLNILMLPSLYENFPC